MEIASRGATLLTWRADVGGRLTDLVDGYTTATELIHQEGVRNGILAPFSNRIAGGSYRYRSAVHELRPGPADPSQPIMHGFLRDVEMELKLATSTDEEARLVFRSRAIRPNAFMGYPFSVDVEVEFCISRRGIRLEITAENTGSEPAPFGAGWHPYFRLGDGGIEHLTLTVPAAEVIDTDASLIPVPGSAAKVRVEQRRSVDYRSARAISGATLDTCFSDLHFDGSGVARTTLSDPAKGCSLEVWQTRGLMHVFTGDTLSRAPRGSIALEPVEVLTNAFGREDSAEAITLHPGETRSFLCGVDVYED